MKSVFLNLPLDEQSQILQIQSEKLKKTPTILEKDVWVCWTLQKLFEMPDAHKMCFKGGTSLSKVYDVVNRFSEDIDVTIDYRSLSGKEQQKDLNRSAASKLSAELRDKLKSYLRDRIIPHFKDQFQELSRRQLSVELDENGESVHLKYNAAVDQSGYIPSRVLLEFGGRNLTEPTTDHKIVPYISVDFPDLIFPVANVAVLALERTFWEKATAVHVECNRLPPRLPPRFSRHWYDLMKLASGQKGTSCLESIEILQSVIEHKSIFWYSSTADYHACITGGIKLVPTGALSEAVKSDYEQMIAEQMFYEAPPSFTDLMSFIDDLQGKINERFETPQSGKKAQ